MMLQRRPMKSDVQAPSAQPTSEATDEHQRVAERLRDGQTLAQEELRQEDHEAEDQRVDRDQHPAADDHALQQRRLQHRASR